MFRCGIQFLRSQIVTRNRSREKHVRITSWTLDSQIPRYKVRLPRSWEVNLFTDETELRFPEWWYSSTKEILRSKFVMENLVSTKYTIWTRSWGGLPFRAHVWLFRLLCVTPTYQWHSAFICLVWLSEFLEMRMTDWSLVLQERRSAVAWPLETGNVIPLS